MDSYSGPVRILDSNGILLTVGGTDLAYDPAEESWSGLLRVISNSAVAGKALQVRLEIPGGNSADAVLDPLPEADGVAFSEISGIGPKPF